MNENFKNALYTAAIIIFLVGIPTLIFVASHKINLNECLEDENHIIEVFTEEKKQCCFDQAVGYYSGYIKQNNCYRLKVFGW